MIFETYHLKKDRKKFKIRQIDINKFEKIATTGSGLALKYKKGKIIYLESEYLFDEYYIKPQKMNDEAVKCRYYSYIAIDKNKPCSPKNRVRDSKGKPIKNYVKPIDCYIENKVNKMKFINHNDFDRIYNKAKELNILYEWYDGVFYSDESEL